MVVFPTLSVCLWDSRTLHPSANSSRSRTTGKEVLAGIACLTNSSQRWVVSPHPAAQVLPGTRGCACWQSPHRRRIAGLEALAGLAHLTASGESEWDCPSCHPGIFQDRGRLRPPAEITQKSDHRAGNSNRLCLHGCQWKGWVRWRTVPSGCFPGEQEAVAAG